jgi:lipopolysaccharide transport system ATP-binding protein
VTKLAVSAEDVAKRYRIGVRGASYRTLRDAVSDRVARRTPQEDARHMWALDGVSFDVAPGEAVGVIGPNGAGKTTLLKILSRITEPTRGEVRVRGRIGALLEVGTGFHPELTGRENVYLNGAILGMRRAEISAKFDEIVAFAELERFIDTPVKRYSSGMYLRLAFAVAAHLDTDILVVDEALSVGDYGFQRRSLGKMQQQTSQEGRTVLFVSHNLGAIRMLTDRCMWLEKGKLRAFGNTDDVFREYIDSYRSAAGGGVIDLADLSTGRPASELPQEIAFTSLELLQPDGESADTHLEGAPIRARVGLSVRKPQRDVRLEIVYRVSTVDGIHVFSTVGVSAMKELDVGGYETGFVLDPNPLSAGTFAIDLYAATMSERVGDKGQDRVSSALTFHVQDNPTPNEDRFQRERDRGVVRVETEWEPLTSATSRVVQSR